MWLLSCLLLGGCLISPDPLLWQRKAGLDASTRDGGPADTSRDHPKDAARPDGDSSSPGDVSVGNCSASGVPGPCDPIGPSGCAQGACYLLPVLGQACVCPIGTISEGSPCNTTKLCVPGKLCAGNQAPGICRKVCRPDASTCPTGMFCRSLSAQPAYGYCDPSADAGGDGP